MKVASLSSLSASDIPVIAPVVIFMVQSAAGVLYNRVALFLASSSFTCAISNYTLVTQGAVDGETPPTDAAAASKKFSILVFPATDIANGDVKATFTIDGTTYSVNLDAPTGTVTIGGNSVDTADKWLAGVNYQYTVRLSGTGLSISTISVTDWVDAPNGSDMDIQ